jgi:hypothetical protein
MGAGGSWLELINTEVHPLEDSIEPEVQEDGLNLSLTKRSKITIENPRVGYPKVQILALEAQTPEREAEANLWGVGSGSEKDHGLGNKLDTMKSVDKDQSLSRRISEKQLDVDCDDK